MPGPRIAIVAAEPSGDLLGAGLMEALRARYPAIRFEGIGGERMLAVGMHALAPMEQLSVMGLVEVLQHLPGLLKLRRELASHWLDDPPALFIGVDAPDFNLNLEARLRAVGVATVHYVSPTVWAWRAKRVDHIRQAVDLLLSIFPFEQAFLQQHGVRSVYVGHTLANEMPVQVDRMAARCKLGLASDRPVLAVLPGSRGGEVGRLARPFLLSAAQCLAQLPDLQIVVPLVNQRTSELFDQLHARYTPDLPLTRVMRDSRSVLAAADVVLTASGTATFETLLSKRPMVVGYKLNGLTYWIARLMRLVKVEHVAMANLLSGERLAPEFIQAACEPAQLVPALLAFFNDEEKVAAVQARYTQIHTELATDTNARAAEAVLQLLRERGLL